ncbi:hypothetical protein C349_05036 [Cryptococcus neoformans var. grubii Br795]|uniref:Rieske domain-containing protein n=1 Tax=Cryptococcus neoformans Tu259-1 TaxID=1230072 RepID=A0A854Q8K2_CRYNE|nr:hypothetical protein C353_05002 [Cryptococcus neoformans var. grubii AD1-83a]OXG15875.1 hypothetical protein C361_05319 [Cryptococcus neoformans var. grubii Tu259-1]OXG53346.1 hypothetical protein C354_04940 [Cryptococcus neoformans var. grubii MW-RSA1955]OXG56742.1 hypothetical protein C352_04919 [Cryptococcus neoformans var. grubii CHC193]OXG60184.1 hypothetical protein C351_04884 [Cryptococcus neoformans var. grubii c8]OXG75982.1 hypothetical protein C350_04885 [Cryptococcus neoformans v
MPISKQFVRIAPLKATFTHTRFHLALRTVDHPVVYHRLLLFRINKPDASLGGSSGSAIGQVLTGPSSWRAPELYCMEETCPHLGAPLSHAEIEDIEDTRAIVCPWHQYDFDLKDGSSSTGLQACTYEVKVQGIEDDAEVWVEAPHTGSFGTDADRQWELVEMRGVSEEFLDPPIPSLPSLSVSGHCSSPSLPPQLSHTAPNLPDPLPTSLLAFAHLILRTSDPQLKCLLTREAVTRLRAGQLKSIRPTMGEIKRERENGGLVDEPPREVEIIAPGKTPRRGKGGSEKSRILMLHALANIEQYAIDLAWDIIARFAHVEVNGERLPVEFFLDWAKVAEDEAKHYTLLARRLVEMGSYFGAHTGKCYDLHSPYTFFAGHSPLDLVHAGLWESATQTAGSLSARIAIIHLVAEARGIDMNPLTLAKLQAAGDAESSKVLEIIHADEITHVTTGHRWFTWLCAKQGLDPIATFRSEVETNFRGKIKGPFNTEDRLKAGLTPDFYEDLTGQLGWKEELVKRAEKAAREAEGDEHLHPRLT